MNGKLREEPEARRGGRLGRAPAFDCGCGTGRIARSPPRVARSTGSSSPRAPPRPHRGPRSQDTAAVFDPAAWQQLGDRRYDAIVFCHVLEHPPIHALTLARRQLVKGGRIVIVLPERRDLAHALAPASGPMGLRGARILDRTHVHFYT